MAETYWCLVTVDPFAVPRSQAVERAITLLRDQVGSEVAIDASWSELPSLRLDMRNFELIHCPFCGEPLDEQEWWPERMAGDFEEEADGFRLEPQRLPCCDQSAPLSELDYGGAAVFARFALRLADPESAPPAALLDALGETLETPVQWFSERY